MLLGQAQLNPPPVHTVHPVQLLEVKACTRTAGRPPVHMQGKEEGAPPRADLSLPLQSESTVVVLST